MVAWHPILKSADMILYKVAQKLAQFYNFIKYWPISNFSLSEWR